jgi:hypothetical protein
VTFQSQGGIFLLEDLALDPLELDLDPVGDAAVVSASISDL